MKFNIEYMEAAVWDIEDISDYLSDFYPNTPTKVLTAIKRSIENLIDNPYMYAEYAKNPAYRKITVQDYLVFYKITEEERTVRIYRVLHGARNLDELTTAF
ncbi:MAG: type II toxin-antitoxin system RelE/ParE family toxin [Oscillospiraceae bacterium]|jgi:addiction module RelE/StbE family toxin|nr:type II toxin-antitoxin system RelE/ParE family toxin [Oscillospiraceae bacterium]